MNIYSHILFNFLCQLLAITNILSRSQAWTTRSNIWQQAYQQVISCLGTCGVTTLYWLPVIALFKNKLNMKPDCISCQHKALSLLLKEDRCIFRHSRVSLKKGGNNLRCQILIKSHENDPLKLIRKNKLKTCNTWRAW